MTSIYDEAYYQGRGADPLVTYLAEVEDPDRSVRVYEWRDVLRVLRAIGPVTDETRWLDLGCGLGGFVSWLNRRGIEAWGSEEGWAKSWCEDHGVPMVDARTTSRRFDVITMIEVIEDVEDPLALFTRARELLRPGGVLWLTTGNARPHRDAITEWNYVIPEIHISFFEPEMLAILMSRAGLIPQRPHWTRGHADIIRFKVLKNLGRGGRGLLERIVPWPLVSPVIDVRYKALRRPYACLPQ